MKLRKIYYNI